MRLLVGETVDQNFNGINLKKQQFFNLICQIWKKLKAGDKYNYKLIKRHFMVYIMKQKINKRLQNVKYLNILL